MTSRTLSALGLVALLAASSACDKATPVAPDGVILSISASPSQVTLTGASTITVVGRKPDGQPLNPGTEVRFSTNIGSVDPIIATVRSGGTATTTFRGDGRSGTATITASTGTTSPTPPTTSDTGGGGSSDPTPPPSTGPTNGIESVSIRIVVGNDPSNRPTLIISANPSTVEVSKTSAITIIARNPDRSPVSAGQSLLLTTTLGTLNPARPTTRADGTATSTLSAGTQAGTATIGAILGSSDQATTTVTIRDIAAAISLSANVASIPRTGGTIAVTAAVLNGQNQPAPGVSVTFFASAGLYTTTDAVQTDTQGLAKNTLTLVASDLPDGVDTVTLTAQTPGAGGFITSNSVVIRVTG